MPEKLKLTKGELKRQKDDLRRFERFLPMLQLKKQQLQMQLLRLDAEREAVEAEREEQLRSMGDWLSLLDGAGGLHDMIRIREVVFGEENIAGVPLPVFEDMIFETSEHDLVETPLWFDRAVPALQQVLTLDARIAVLNRRRERIARELTVTSQRVNLFERVRIPRAKDNIRRLKIFLGDQQAAAVVRGKIAKRKREEEKDCEPASP